MGTPLTATGARKQWAHAAMILEAAHSRVQTTTSRGALAIELELQARLAEDLAKWAREYARLMSEVHTIEYADAETVDSPWVLKDH